MLTDNFSELENLRLAKLEQLRLDGIEPYPTRSFTHRVHPDRRRGPLRDPLPRPGERPDALDAAGAVLGLPEGLGEHLQPGHERSRRPGAAALDAGEADPGTDGEADLLPRGPEHRKSPVGDDPERRRDVSTVRPRTGCGSRGSDRCHEGCHNRRIHKEERTRERDGGRPRPVAEGVGRSCVRHIEP